MPERVVVKHGTNTTEFVYSGFADFNNPLAKIEALWPGRIVESRNGKVSAIRKRRSPRSTSCTHRSRCRPACRRPVRSSDAISGWRLTDGAGHSKERVRLMGKQSNHWIAARGGHRVASRFVARGIRAVRRRRVAPDTKETPGWRAASLT